MIDGPNQKRSAESDRFKVDISDIPVKVCPKGCSGFYWYWPDLGVEVLDMLNARSDNIARRKGFLRVRQLCKSCGQDLEEGSSHTFRFQERCHKGTIIEMAVSGPSLVCKRCNLYYLPAQTATWDAYYSELADVIGEALTRDLIAR